MKENKKIVIWGTGNVADLIVKEYTDINPDFFIDNNKDKNKTLFHKKSVYHPEEINNWGDLYIIIATDYYKEIERQLKDISEEIKWVYYKDYLLENLSISNLKKEVKVFIDYLNENKSYNENKIIFFGDFVSYDRGICNFINEMDDNIKSMGLFLFSEADLISEKYISDKIKIDFREVPALLKKNIIFKEDISYSSIRKIIEYVNQHEYLKIASINLRKRHRELGENYEFIICYYTDYCVKKIIEHWKPYCIILWNKFYAVHSIIDYLCKINKVPVKYMEFGVLPGTFVIENRGQMGESYPAVFTTEFNQLPLKAEEVNSAKKILEFMNSTGINRNIQENSEELLNLEKKLINKRPTILFAGQNDYESGLQPYNEISEKFHSPIFRSTDEAVIYLAKIAKENDWNIIFKPHPIMTKYIEGESNYPENVVLINRGDINKLIDRCDVCITILSQVGYISTIRKKPTLMLGYTQLKGKGITYEAFSKKEVVEQLKIALTHGFTKSQQILFEEHVARLLKYYLYDDMRERSLRYGKSIKDLNVEILKV